MGYEAKCLCQWGAATQEIKALLEASELILRGNLRRKLPFAQIEQPHVQQERLTFRFDGEVVSLLLGEPTATKWCRVLTSPPKSLAKKMGISAETKLWFLGQTEDQELAAALSTAQELTAKNPDLIVSLVDSSKTLASVLTQTRPLLTQGLPIWIVYPKGKGHQVSEALVRSTARDAGLVDTKVVSVSSALTGLRFHKPR